MNVDVKTDKYVRVVGYYAKEGAMNDGKQQELLDREEMTKCE